MTRRLLTTGGAAAAAGLTVALALPWRKRTADVEPEPGALQPMSALRVVPTPAPPTPIRFLRQDGATVGLDAYAGQGLVVNLWATWCAPCVRELPSLAALAKTLSPDHVAVLPLSSDHGGIPVVRAFFKEHGIVGLPALSDPDGNAAIAWKTRGIPTTIVIDRHGLVRAWLEGAADWAAPGAADTIRKLTS